MAEHRRHRDGEEAYADAVERLESARTSQGELDDRAEAAQGTAHENDAADAKAAGRDRIAAREAWAVWTERERGRPERSRGEPRRPILGRCGTRLSVPPLRGVS